MRSLPPAVAAFAAFVVLVLGACSGDGNKSPRPADQPSSVPTTETPATEPTDRIAITASAPQSFAMSTLSITPQSPSTDRNDPAVQGPQTLVYDSVTGSITVAGEGTMFEGANWLSATQLLVKVQSGFAIYDAAARTWRGLGLNIALDLNSIAIASSDGSRVAIQIADRSLVLVDLRGLTYRTLSLAARPVAWSPDSTRLLVHHERAPNLPQPAFSLINAANPSSAVQLPHTAQPPDFNPDYRQWLSDALILGTYQNPPRIILVNVSGPSPSVITTQAVGSEQLAPSPDGRLVAVREGGFPAPSSVVVYRLDPFTRVTEIAGASLGGQLFLRGLWTNDSKRLLAFRDMCTSAESLVLIDLDTGSETKVVQSGSYTVALSPDNRWVT